jgi:hypothetical protein
MWFDSVAPQGDEIERKARDAIQTLMTPKEVEEGQRLARQWMPKELYSRNFQARKLLGRKYRHHSNKLTHT